MFDIIEFNLSAFRHGVGVDDIRSAFLHPCYDGQLEGLVNKYIRIGFDRSGNLLEIMYNEIDDHTVKYFMP